MAPLIIYDSFHKPIIRQVIDLTQSVKERQLQDVGYWMMYYSSMVLSTRVLKDPQ